MTTSPIALFLVAASVALGVSVLLDKVIVPLLVRRKVKKILSAIDAGQKTGTREYDWEITFDSVGLCVGSIKMPGTQCWSMKWEEIHKVTAFKRDLFTYDQICLFFSRTDGSGSELSEEMKGWLELLEELPKFLLPCKRLEDWIWKVSTPAFAVKATEIFCRKEAEPESSIRAA